MRLRSKSFVLLSMFVFGGLLLGAIVVNQLPQDKTGLIVPILLLWFVGWGIAIQTMLRCPHCGMPATLTPGGWYVPWVGATCRYCGKPY